MKISKRLLELSSGHDFHTEIYNRHNCASNVGGVTVLVFCTSSDHFCICTKFRENISKGFRVIEGTCFVTDRRTDVRTTI